MAAMAAVALSSCTPGGDAATPTTSGTDAGTAASATNGPGAKRCQEITSQLGILADGLTLDAGASEYSESGDTNCSWKRGGTTVLRFGIGRAMGDPAALMEEENPLVIADPTASGLGGVVTINREGGTLAEVGDLALVLPKHGLTLGYAGPAEGMPGSASIADVARALAGVNEALPARP